MSAATRLAVLLSVMFTACVDRTIDAPRDPVRAGAALQSTCDSLLTRATEPSLRMRAEPPWPRRLLDSTITPLGAIRVDDAWVVLDAGTGSLRAYGEVRTPLPRPRHGDGPGELSPMGAIGFRHQQLARIANGEWLIGDAIATHRFSPAGRPEQRIVRDVATFGPWSDLQVAPWSDSTFLVGANHVGGASLALEASRDRLDLLELRPRARAPVPFIRLDNTFAFTHPGSRGNGLQPPMAPYRDVFGRTWDARGGTLVFTSYRQRGLCAARRDGGRWSLRSFRSPGPAPRVDAAERARVLALYGASAERLHGARHPLVDSFTSRWPPAPPPYEDLLLTDKLQIWALRAAGAGREAVDVFDPRDGYRYSFDPSAAYGRSALPMAVDGLLALLQGFGGGGVIEIRLPE